MKLYKRGFTALLIFLICSTISAIASQDIPARSIISKDTVWSGDILVHGDVRVEEGVTLIILPGTTISFMRIPEFGPEKISKDRNDHFPRAELVIRGRLIAQGLPCRHICFTSAEKSPSAGDWGAVNFIGSRDNIMEFCELSYGHTSVHCHSAQVVVSHCIFHDNGVAIGQKNVKKINMKSSVPMMYNRIAGNGGGILFGGGTSPDITHNEINNNKFFGIYAKKSGCACIRYNNIENNGKGIILYAVKDIIIRDNNITRNLEYNISMLEGQERDVDARYNWWGTTDTSEMSRLVMDKKNDAALGHVDYTRFTSAPVPGAGLPW